MNMRRFFLRGCRLKPPHSLVVPLNHQKLLSSGREESQRTDAFTKTLASFVERAPEELQICMVEYTRSLRDFSLDPRRSQRDRAFDTFAKLAYLSTCSMEQKGNVGLMNETLHVASIFQLVGFSQVIGTLWVCSGRKRFSSCPGIQIFNSAQIIEVQ